MIEKIGGSIKAIASGYFQEKIGDSAYRQQKGIEGKEKIIVRMNEFVDGEELPIKIFRPPEDTVEKKQKKKLKRLRETRDNHRVLGLLKEVERVARTEENLVPILVEAVKNYATVGEICDAFRRVFGEYEETRFY